MPLTENFAVEYGNGRLDRYTLQRRGSELAVSCTHYDCEGYLTHTFHRPYCKGSYFGKSQLTHNVVTERDFYELRDLLLQIAN